MSDYEDRIGRTIRLELSDPDLLQFEAKVLQATPEGIVLDRSAFYPGGGGQPPDEGTLTFEDKTTSIIGVQKENDLRLIPALGDPLPQVNMTVTARINIPRRLALMRTHSALHLLSGVIFRDFGALVTGGNMEPLSARADFNLTEIPTGFKETLEETCSREILKDHQILTSRQPREIALSIPNIIRTATNLLPPELEIIRIVDIVGLDTQADGGTHVNSTSKIGKMTITKIENKGKGFRRVRFTLS